MQENSLIEKCSVLSNEIETCSDLNHNATKKMGKDESGGQVKNYCNINQANNLFLSSSQSAQNYCPNCHERLKLEREGKQKQFQEQETQRKQ